MNHDNICTTIKELLQKVESLNAKIRKNAGKAGRHYQGLDRIEPGSGSRAMEAMEQNKKLKTKLADVYDDFGRAYQQKGDEGTARYYFDQA